MIDAAVAEPRTRVLRQAQDTVRGKLADYAGVAKLGKRAALKMLWEQSLVGSSPTTGTSEGFYPVLCVLKALWYGAIPTRGTTQPHKKERIVHALFSLLFVGVALLKSN